MDVWSQFDGDVRLSLTNLRRLLVKSRSFWGFLGLAVALVIVSGGVVAQGAQSAQGEILNSTIMRTVEVSSYGMRNPIPLTNQWIQRIDQLPHVVAARPWLQAGMSVVDSPIEVPGALWATPRMPAGQPGIVKSTSEAGHGSVGAGEAILPLHVAKKNLTGLLGRTVTIEYIRKTSRGHGEAVHLKIRIVGLYDDSAGGRDGQRGTAAYFNLRTVQMMAAAGEGVTSQDYGRSVGYPKVVVEARSSGDVPELQHRLTSYGFNASSVQQQLADLPPAMALINILGKVLSGLLALVGLGGGLSVGANLVRSRVRDIGLLKAIGYRSRRVVRVFAVELALFGLSAGLLGMCVGLFLNAIAGSLLGGHELMGVRMADHLVTPSMWTVIGFGLLPTAAIMVGSVGPLFRAWRLPPDVALRDPYA